MPGASCGVTQPAEKEKGETLMPITFEPIPEWLLDELAELVEGALLRLGMPRTLVGFRYHADAIARAVQEPRCTDYITKELYPDIARAHRTTAARVERAMRTAVQHCWKSEQREALDEMAGYHLTKRPTNSEFIQLVAAYIRRRA